MSEQLKLKYLNQWKNQNSTLAFASLNWMKTSDTGSIKQEIYPYHYIHQYKASIDCLIENIDFDIKCDLYILPFLFLTKHYIELSLKYLITYFTYFIDPINFDRDKVNKKLGDKGHDLSKLYDSMNHNFTEFNKIHNTDINKETKAYCKKSNDYKGIINCNRIFSEKSTIKFFPLLKEFVDLLSMLDVSDSAFKYSIDKQNNPNLENINYVNMECLYCYLEQIDMLMIYIDSGDWQSN